MRSFFGSAALGLALLFIGPALAQDHEEHGDHGDHGGGAQAVGVVNSIDAAGRTVNVTHEPIPDLGWTPPATGPIPTATIRRRIPTAVGKWYRPPAPAARNG